MNQFLSKYKWRILITAIGGFAGFLYWYYIGCESGICPIQSNWHTSSLYGGLLGYLFSDITNKKKSKDEEDGTV